MSENFGSLRYCCNGMPFLTECEANVKVKEDLFLIGDAGIEEITENKTINNDSSCLYFD